MDGSVSASRPSQMSLRILLTVGLLFVFGSNAYYGVELFAYQRLSDRISAELGREPGTAQSIGSSDASAISSWWNITGVAGWARGLLLAVVQVHTPEDKLAIERATAAVAEVSPTWAAGWQDLAAARLASGAPMEKVIAAFRMSSLTGSHEGFVMARRAIFGLEHWSDLPGADQHTVIRDVLATVGPGSINNRYHKILAAKSPASREEIRAALVASGLATKDVLQSLGI
jgi:hypothetical protein